MENLSISKETVLEAYEAAGRKTKSVLTSLFGEKVFVKEITDRVKTFEDALEVIGETEEQFKERTQYDSVDEIAYKKVKIIAQALNEGWVPDWTNTDEYKYYCWFKYVGSGVGFSFYDYYYDRSDSGVGSRLVFRTSALAEYAGKQFLDIYRAYMVIE